MAHLITSSTPANTHVFFAGIVVLKAVPENITTIRMVCEVASHGNRIENLPNLIQEETGIPMTIDYYNRFRLEFPQGAIAFVQGVLSMEPAQATGASPKVLIRADQLVPMQGDPNSDEYEKHEPFLVHGSLSFVGEFKNGITNPGHRLFVFMTTVYNNEYTSNKDAPKYSTFKVVCVLPDGPRWNNFWTPSRGTLMQASGDWIGYHEIDGVHCPCVMVTAFSFIRASTNHTPIHPIFTMFSGGGDCCCPECTREYREDE